MNGGRCIGRRINFYNNGIPNKERRQARIHGGRWFRVVKYSLNNSPVILLYAHVFRVTSTDQKFSESVTREDSVPILLSFQ